MSTLNANQKKTEFIKLVGDENSNIISSSNNRNSCLLIQSDAFKKGEFEYNKYTPTKNEKGQETYIGGKNGVPLSQLNAFSNADITDVVRSYIDWLFFENSKGKWNSKNNKNQWQVTRDSSVCAIAIYKASSEFTSPIIASDKLNKQGKISISHEFIDKYFDRLNKDQSKFPIYLSFNELKQTCLSWFNVHKASSGTATKLKGLSAIIERINKIVIEDMDNDFEKHDGKLFDKMTMLVNTINLYKSKYKSLYPENFKILAKNESVKIDVKQTKKAS